MSHEYQKGRPHGMRYQEGPLAATLTGIYNFCCRVRALLDSPKQDAQLTRPQAANDQSFGHDYE